VDDVTATHAVDQQAADLRDMVDEYPQFAEMLRSPSPWRDGVRLAIVDCLVYRSDPDQMLARMWAWLEATKL